MKTIKLIVQCLENDGVECIFGIPGEENLDLLDALLSSSIRFVMKRHEQGAAFMADVYGRLTGKAGVCLSTLGTEATNIITGVADANMDHAPLAALTGQPDQSRLHKESHQHLDIVSLFRPVTKWNTSLPIPEAFLKAFKLAQAEKPGATHIEILADSRAALASDDIVISDVGARKVRLARFFPCLLPNTRIISNGFAAMGMAVPGAVAAKLVYPNHRVVAVTGDGGFFMNSQELETAARMETPFVVLVFNDCGYGLIRWKQMRQFNRTAFVDFTNPDIAKYAESFGANGYRIESADE